ncbi:MAG: PQQ-dependent sugar dehydrogenase [Phycisphaeraceae bacterium]|nr:PQQ-dependent sugar dehydrogenase [Phycisphaeraceae bacterium]
MAIRLLLPLALLCCATLAWAVENPASPDAPPVGPMAGEVGPGVPPFVVRPGFRVTLAADGLGAARFLEFDDQGTLYVSQIQQGKVLALRDPDESGRYRKISVFLQDQKHVHGLCWHDGWLWFAPSTAVGKARDTSGDGVADEVRMVLANLPGGSGHLWRSLLVTDDGFYTSVGDPGNVNDETHTDREKIWLYNLDGGGKKLFVSGIRNTEKLRLRPGTREVWGCDHGSDNIGQPYGERPGLQPVTDLNPPDEFNHYVEGGFYGHPFVAGLRLIRPEYANRPDILALAAKTIVPAWAFHAHVATNGFCFVSLDNRHLPADWRGDAVVPMHGSWNSTKRVGYAVVRVRFDPWTGKPCGQETILSTLDASGNVLERPVDCAQAPDGSILFSSDFRNRIYRITWVGRL